MPSEEVLPVLPARAGRSDGPRLRVASITVTCLLFAAGLVCQDEKRSGLASLPERVRTAVAERGFAVVDAGVVEEGGWGHLFEAYRTGAEHRRFITIDATIDSYRYLLSQAVRERRVFELDSLRRFAARTERLLAGRRGPGAETLRLLLQRAAEVGASDELWRTEPVVVVPGTTPITVTVEPGRLQDDADLALALRIVYSHARFDATTPRGRAAAALWREMLDADAPLARIVARLDEPWQWLLSIDAQPVPREAMLSTPTAPFTEIGEDRPVDASPTGIWILESGPLGASAGPDGRDPTTVYAAWLRFLRELAQGYESEPAALFGGRAWQHLRVPGRFAVTRVVLGHSDGIRSGAIGCACGRAA